MLLANRGLRVVTIERDAAVYALPRAVMLDGEIVRALQPSGHAAPVDAMLQKIRPGDRAGFANSRREWLFGGESVDFGLNGWQPANFFSQPELEGYLRDQVLQHPNITSFVPITVTGITQDSAQVTLEVTSPENPTQTISATWLIACDGASSFTRRNLGIEWKSLGYDHDWLVVDVRTRPGHTLGNATMQVCDPDRLTTYVATKDPGRRWEFRLLPGETRDMMLDPERIMSLIDPWTPRGTYDILRAAVYQFHAATAQDWRKGRILIAGDAAHQTPPFLGQGMNTGMRDAVNLAWKLPLVINGVCSERLLDSYQAERQAHAEDLIEWAVSIGRLMEHMADVERAQREGRMPPQTPGGLKAAGYGQGRGQPPLKSGVIIAGQVSDQGATGHLFAQPVVRDAAGHECRLDDLLGENFALVGKTAASVQLTPANRALFESIGGHIIHLDGLTPVRGHFDRIFNDADVVLVRPDRYIFGHSDSRHTADVLVEALAHALTLQEQL